MVTLRSSEQPQQETMEKAHKVSDYELCREERIRENRERMQKLGIVDLSGELKALKPTPNRAYRRKPLQDQTPLLPSGPVRRSSRLQNSTPVSYCEVHLPKNENSLNDDRFLREEWSRPEVYTEEHEKLLGNTEMSWTLFVDGYGKDGKRIYDPVRGKTCHQCRQKTLGHRTHCSKCNLVQGQFCGDCLYMRYGEHVLEANANPNWICPACRGICNCSLCRQAKGWPPTGTLYRKVSSLGYKSVAHYLIQTRRSDTTTDSDENVGNKLPVSAKRSLPFSDVDATMGEDDLSRPSGEHLKTDPLPESNEDFCSSKISPESSDELLPKPEPEKVGAGHDKEADFLVDSDIELKTVEEQKTSTEPLIPETVDRDDDNEIKKEKNNILEDNDFVAPEITPRSTKKRVRSEPTPDSISGRLRQRQRNNPNTTEDMGTRDAAEGTPKIADVDCIASRLKMRRRA